jgi:peptide/nickel transport system permease protein/dipeptide transport system permease protein
MSTPLSVMAPPRAGASRRARLAVPRAWRAIGAGGLVMLVAVAVAAFAPTLAPHDATAFDLLHRLAPPAWDAGGSWAHPLGTDPLGRDVLSRIIYGARTSLAIAGAAMLVAAALGILLGLVSGYAGSWADALIMRLADIQLSFPYLLLAIAVMALLKPSLVNLILVLVLRSWVVYARLVRVVTRSAREREFVTAARALGGRGARIVFRHIAPNVVGPSIVVSSFQLAELIIVESSLSFLGLGVQPPTPSWGSMVSEGRAYISSAWWLSAFPGLAIVLAVLGANLTGDALRRALDPRLRGV